MDERYRQWRTIDFQRTVLVVVRTVTTLTRLLDILALIESDLRIQAVYTYDPWCPAIFAAGVPEFLGELGAPVIPWEQARGTRFDLAIAASENDALHELDAPILLVPHGIGYQKYYPGGRVTSGMNPERLLRGGRVVPDTIALSHPAQREQLRAACPPAEERAVVIGDPCHDRMRVSAHRVPHYRDALGSGERRLVVLCSTWGPGSLFGTWPRLPERLLGELPADEYQVAAILHPGVWAAHGHRQVRAWLRPALDAGLALIPPERGWQATVLAADCVLSDEGSATLYAAAMDKPLLLATGVDPADTTVPGSPLADLTRKATRLEQDRDLRAQLDQAIGTHRAGAHGDIVERVVRNSGRCAEVLAGLVYRRLGLEPAQGSPTFPPVDAPVTEIATAAAHLVGGRVTEDGAVTLVRFPAVPTGSPPYWESRHLTADAERATLRQLENATIVHSAVSVSDFDTWSRHALRQWPDARMASAPLGERGCVLRTREGRGVTLEFQHGGADPRLLASLARVRLESGHDLPTVDTLRLGERDLAVRIRGG
ncbi:hypothetical protein [Amycolatopsis cihanbeyliensis]|uniref:CDP-glycerol:poly(Glycerophosphate) glycerophosphotransferase n=1 Tax=Amycolatopsis cihanbeyliensis TaxID=1128664 RepID=A0A542DLW5_AMYCI|nr:hypothetical protein [Amycolatopsis cihanbeyliensis]TQJ04080.1 hypothetical protein FB471_3861 [Amycolatopsis cihanbeyliensis]